MDNNFDLRQQKFYIKNLIWIKQGRIDHIQREIEFLKTKMQEDKLFKDIKAELEKGLKKIK